MPPKAEALRGSFAEADEKAKTGDWFSVQLREHCVLRRPLAGLI